MSKRSTDHERSKPPSVVIHTHGCKLNAADSQVLASEFIGAGCVVVDDIREADIYVLNTCTVTAQADYKARKALRSVAKINPSILLSATGCYVQRRPEDLLDMTTDAGAPILLGNAKKDVFVTPPIDYLSALKKAFKGRIVKNETHPIYERAGSIVASKVVTESKKNAKRKRT